MWLNAVCQINLCLTSLLILDPSASSLQLRFASFPSSLSCLLHTDAPSRPAWQEWWDVSTRYYTHPNIFTLQAGRLAGWERIRGDRNRKTTAIQRGSALKKTWAIFRPVRIQFFFFKTSLYQGCSGGGLCHLHLNGRAVLNWLTYL